MMRENMQTFMDEGPKTKDEMTCLDLFRLVFYPQELTRRLPEHLAFLCSGDLRQQQVDSSTQSGKAHADDAYQDPIAGRKKAEKPGYCPCADCGEQDAAYRESL